MNLILVTGHPEHVAPWVLDQIHGGYILKDLLPNMWHTTLATVDADTGEIKGGCIYANLKRGEVCTDMELYAAGGPQWLPSRRFIKAYFWLPFVQYNCTRVTTICSKKNKKARKMQMRLGFTEEGNAREAMSDGSDALIYGMLKRDCKWIR